MDGITGITISFDGTDDDRYGSEMLTSLDGIAIQRSDVLDLAITELATINAHRAANGLPGVTEVELVVTWSDGTTTTATVQ